MSDNVAEIVGKLTEAQRTEIKAADRSGVIPTIAAIVVLLGIQMLFGSAAAFWFGIGGLCIGLTYLWEAGRNAEIEERATEKWVRAYLENSQAAATIRRGEADQEAQCSDPRHSPAARRPARLGALCAG